MQVGCVVLGSGALARGYIRTYGVWNILPSETARAFVLGRRRRRRGGLFAQNYRGPAYGGGREEGGSCSRVFPTWLITRRRIVRWPDRSTHAQQKRNQSIERERNARDRHTGLRSARGLRHFWIYATGCAELHWSTTSYGTSWTVNGTRVNRTVPVQCFFRPRLRIWLVYICICICIYICTNEHCAYMRKIELCTWSEYLMATCSYSYSCAVAITLYREPSTGRP